MKTTKSRKITYIVLGFLGAVLIVGAAIAGPVEAKKKSSNSQNNSRCSHSCGPYTIAKGGYTYSVTVSANHYCRLGWPGWACQNLLNEATAAIGPTFLSNTWNVGCGNVHTFSGRIVSVPVVNKFPPGGRLTGTSTSSSNTDSSDFTTECTPGVDCPDVDLGKIINKAELRPSIARTSDSKCPFYWLTGAENSDQKISCKLVINGVVTEVPNVQPDPINGYLLPVGETTFVCTRTGRATSTVSQTLRCNGNPNVIEH